MSKNDVDFSKFPSLEEEPVLWQDRMRPFFGLPLSFTKYILYSDRLMVERGFLNFRLEELRLYRIRDITLHQNIFQRMFGVGSIQLSTIDASNTQLFLHDIKNPQPVMRMLSQITESERQRNGVRFVEGYDPHCH